MIPTIFTKWLKVLRKIVFDPYTWSKPERWTTLAGRTFRYRAASMGIALTKNEKRLLSYQDCHHGQRAFIIGNGPSLNQCDLTS